jgi:PPK2 family polyphosphate:nucleotide phosphotransferase
MEKFRVEPDEKVDLSKWDPNDKSEYDGSKSDAKKELKDLVKELEGLQALLFAEHKHKVLIILQAMDTGGKDGTIRHVFDRVNPQGVNVVNFKVPTPIELDHDYLWRIHQHTPGKGEITIFNRSHYEDVLVVRVHELVPEEIWSRRFTQINDFEKMLADEGTTILKFYLHINLDEQKERLQDRLDEPDKHWKFHSQDLQERKRWNEYMRAYEDVLSKTSKRWAPWYIIPANVKWYRNYIVASTIVDTLNGLDMKYPDPEEGLEDIEIE